MNCSPLGPFVSVPMMVIAIVLGVLILPKLGFTLFHLVIGSIPAIVLSLIFLVAYILDERQLRKKRRRR